MGQRAAELRADVQRIIIEDVLRLALPLLAGASLVGVVLGVLSDSLWRVGTPLIGLVVCVTALVFDRRGKPERAAQVLMLGYGASALFAMTFSGGLRAPAATLLLTLVAMVGWVYGREAATRATWLSIAVVFGIGLLSRLSLLPERSPPPPLVHAAFASLYLLLIWLTTALPQERLRAALTHSLEREDALQAEQRRREEADLAFRAIFEHATHVMLLVDPKGVVVDANRAALTFLALERREAIIGQPLLEAAAWPATEKPRLREVLTRALTAKAESLRCEFPTPTRTFEFTFAPSLDEQTLRYLIVEGRDVTVQLEAERHAHRARRLELVGQLAGGVAHDFNNVLAAILSSSEMVKAELQTSGPLSGEVREGLETISASSMRAADLTRRLLTFARRTPLEKQVHSMHELLGSTVKLLTRSLPPTVKLVTALEAPRDTVEADAASVESMLLNLAVNARDAMPGGGTLTLSTSQVGGFLRVTVGDTGSGVAPEHLDRIFEPYFTTKAEGSGIGLASVFGAMRAHGGTVEVDSTVGQGTRFQLDFPLVDAAPTVAAVKVNEFDLSGLRALVVDDEAPLRRVMARMLRPLGIESALLPDAESALVEFEKAPESFELAILDIVLPGRSGAELAVDLLARAPQLRVLFVSGYPRDAELAAFPKDRVRLLGKPFTPEALRDALTSLRPVRSSASR
jgi:PAS domain S-box-containing protein